MCCRIAQPAAKRDVRSGPLRTGINSVQVPQSVGAVLRAAGKSLLMTLI
jgi:hypothetical protein